MSDTYTPSSVRNIAYTRPLDGDTKAVASVDVWLQGLADMSEYLRRHLESQPALNWKPTVVLPKVHRKAVLNVVEGKWYAVSDSGTDICDYSLDFGESWVDAAPSSGAALSDIAVDPSGNMVIAMISNNVTSYTHATTTFVTTASPFASGGSPSGPTVVYDIANGQWCILYRNSTSGLRAYTSTNLTTWTNQTGGLPAAFTGYTGTNNPQMGINPAGQIVACLYTGSGFDLAYSNDGGVTWTHFTIAASAGMNINARPIWSAQDATWMLAVHGSGGSEIWTAPDAAGTWTKVYTNVGATAVQFKWLANVDCCWLACDNSGFLYYSVDVGVTWRTASLSPAHSSTPWIYSGGGGFLYMEESTPNGASSHRYGLQGFVI